MLGTLWSTFLFQPILQLLIFFYKALFLNFGLAILGLTLAIRLVLIPFTLPSQRTAKKMQDLKPRLDELKKKHGKDPKRFQQEQLNLYKEHGVNPMGGCLPMVLQLLVLIALYQVFIQVLNTGMIDGLTVHTQFLWLDLTKPDPYFILPILAGLSQFALSKMMVPQKPRQKGGEFSDELASAMQVQMTYFFPILSVVISARFASGLALYWVASTLFSMVQQYYVMRQQEVLPVKSKGIQNGTSS
ncbi:MAG TPA: YidC/Oxa1 family membrane protein insertase [Patescibacteria group bacterium]|nr:YidC/Oxa1 family membrane protein insertase [Patescibacteria group bacterium]